MLFYNDPLPKRPGWKWLWLGFYPSLLNDQYLIANRSSEDTSLSQADLSGGMCFIMYTSGAEEKLSCIQRTACEDPKTASEYATAAKMVYKVHKMVGLNFSPKYETVLNALEDAKSHSLRGGDCTVYAW